VVLGPEEVARLLEAAPGPKYKAALSAAYAAGLCVSEVVALKVSDIDSERLLLRIEQGKGRKARSEHFSTALPQKADESWRRGEERVSANYGNVGTELTRLERANLKLSPSLKKSRRCQARSPAHLWTVPSPGGAASDARTSSAPSIT
jgi:integrase